MNPQRLPAAFCFTLLFITSAAVPAVRADEPLHVRLDRLILDRADGPVAERAGDGEFLRRIYLDLAGRIPTSAEARAFLDDPATDKRERVVDELLNGPRYADRMTDLFHVMLTERRARHDEWFSFLRRSFEDNKPWDQMVREMLAPDAENETTRGSAFFYTARLDQYGQNPPDVPGLVRDVGRLFLGVDVQCAECHDHLFIDDYHQADFQGLFAFVGNTFIRRDKTFPAVGENPLTEKVAFKSVFDGVEMRTAPRLPGGDEIELPEIAKGEEYLVPPDRKERTPGVLKFSPLKALAETLPRTDNQAFSRNIANRLWWVMMGRGLVDPLDLHHGDNPPSHPELLDLLADELANHQFDMKWFLRQLALSETYQRSSLLPDGTSDEDVPLASYRAAIERPLSSEQLLVSLLVATGEASRVDGLTIGAASGETNADAEASSEKKTPLDELRGRFDRAFANPPKEPELRVNPTVKAALFLSNDSVVLSWFAPRAGNLISRLAGLDEAAAVADELYLSILTRRPSDDERVEVARYLDEWTGPRETALGHLAWALASSTEFFVNH